MKRLIRNDWPFLLVVVRLNAGARIQRVSSMERYKAWWGNDVFLNMKEYSDE